MSIFTFLSLLFSVNLFVFANAAPPWIPQFHRRMSNKQLNEIFKVNSIERVPDYEVVRVRMIWRERNDDKMIKNVLFTALENQYFLQLERNTDFDDQLQYMKMYRARAHLEPSADRNHKEVGEERWKNNSQVSLAMGVGMSNGPRPQQAVLISLRAVEVTCDLLKRNYSGWDGLIGADLITKPVTAQFLTMEDENDDDGEFEDDDDEYDDDEINDFEYDEEITLSKIQNRNEERPFPDPKFKFFNDYLKDSIIHPKSETVSSRPKSKTVWPEIVLFVDYKNYNRHDRDYIQIRRYYINLLNAVDLRYRTFSFPKIRMILTGIVVADVKRSGCALPENSRLAFPNSNLVDDVTALFDLSEYVYNVEHLPKYDIVVALTAFDLISLSKRKTEVVADTTGMAYIDGACRTREKQQRVLSVSLIEDRGMLNSVITATHEIAHLLGSVHDESSSTNGGLGALIAKKAISR
ncbi:a disintegrin and metalloproteinase with thrombospondin motifs 5 [Caerostris extrusa]|uniref:A disintegrin and metalloproteinase with thrombospondin motifs 5 n=1 Tax=Caerostris extrusa TaxID=172846 RepID=A0AAV4Q2H5_CAEEX|nr:a disintegrin and metalloproteinase with thrombospondin motifs 5 [Caerostris extrusa]